jgi:hypothetical protein
MTMLVSRIACEDAYLARAPRRRQLVPRLAVLLCLAGLGFIDARAIAQEFVGMYRWRTATGPTVLTSEEGKATAAKPGSEIKECASGCPVMVVIPAGKFVMGSPQHEPDRQTGEGPQHEVTFAQPFAASKFEVRSRHGMLASPRRGARESLTVGDVGRCR